MILVTGATGHLGSATIEHLLKRTSPENIVALARDDKKAVFLKEKGIEVRIGDFNDKASLDNAMKGISRVLLISTVSEHRLEEHYNVVDAAKKAGVKHIVYTSISMRDVESSALKGLMDSHFQTEKYIKESGLTYTILRNAQYIEVIPMFAGEKVLETGIYLPAGDGMASFALRREMGEAAANVLLEDGHENKIYNITGNDVHTYGDVAGILSELSRKEVHYTNADVTRFPEDLKQFGVPDFAIQLVTGFAVDTKNGQFERVSNDLENLLGRKPATLKEGLKEVYGF